MKLIIILVIGLAVCACAPKPKTYSECILENMKNVQSDIAAREIGRACYDKFKDTY